MTSRLKKKLDSIGVDGSKVTESFCMIGTPLPSLEKTKDSNEFVPVWQQDVRDEQGRRRLHGAFTGGFSAGYFNTVGSKEGWTPATFKSSRDKRAINKNARPEDFMDEEDKAEMRDSQTMIDTTQESDLFGGTEAEMRKRQGPTMPENDSIANALADLLPAPIDSVGAQLLKKMGWRMGQGVGPRVTYKQLKAQDAQSSAAPSSIPDVEEEEEASKHTYAPRDTKVIAFRPKENSFGLGYAAGAGLVDLVQDSGTQKDSRAPNISAGFGLGALNDADDDDIDVYDTGPAQRGRTAYDAGDGNNERVTLGSAGDTGRSFASRPSRVAPSSDFQHTFHDGRPVLTGFVLADKPIVEDAWFEIPDVPKGWKPSPQVVWATGAAKVPPIPLPPTWRPDASRWKEGGMTAAEARGAKLGEAGLPDQGARSVFEYLSKKDQERLKNLASAARGDQTVPSTSDPSHQPRPIELEIVIPTIEKQIAQAALRGFQPFSTDAIKQARYTSYLQSQAYPPNSVNYTPPPPQKPGQAIDDYNKELEDYVKAALIFKPMSGAMANRFTSASIVETGPKAQEGLHQPSAQDSYVTTPIVGEEKKMEESPKQNAARLGMYGPLTREVKEWSPARLLCKRFGVKNPRPDVSADAEDDGPAYKPPTASTSTSASTAMPIAFASSSTAQATTQPTDDTPLPSAPTTRSGPRDLNNVGLGEDEDQGRDTLTYERPGMDIFKAIFASDDEDSDDEGDIVPVAKIITTPTVKPATATLASIPLPTAAKLAADQKEDDATVDPTAFRPKFVSKAARDGTDSSRSKAKEKEKKKKHTKPLVSFGMDGEEEMRIVPDTKKKKKGKDREKKRVREDNEGEGRAKKKKEKVDDEEDIWVEKAAPDVVMREADDVRREGLPPETGGGNLKGRMKASDFL